MIVIHVLAAALLVGPQLLLWIAVVPSTWIIQNEALRRDVTRVITARYGMIAGVSLIGILITGFYLLFVTTPAPIREHMNEYNFGPTFSVKMLVFITFLGLLVYHVFSVARRISRLTDAAIEAGPDADTSALDSQRRVSFVVSFFMLLASIAVLVLGAMLGHHDFSYVKQ